MSTEAVNEIGRGRVWTGQQAVANGLVDTLGGLSLALKIAAAEAGIEDYSTVDYPKEKDLFTRLMAAANDKEDIVLRQRIQTVVPFYQDLVDWSSMAPVQARLPYILRME